MTDISPEMAAHIERTRREASHSYASPEAEAIELVEWLTDTFGKGCGGIAASFGRAGEMPRAIPNLSSEHSIIPPKRGRGRPRKVIPA